LRGAQKVALVEAAKEMLRAVKESKRNDFDGIATGDESRFQHTTASSKMFARSAKDVIPMTRSAVGAKKTLTSVFFTAKKLTVVDILPGR
jgi:hypothetical protein